MFIRTSLGKSGLEQKQVELFIDLFVTEYNHKTEIY